MADDTELIPFEYLLSGSTTSLENAMLRHLAEARNRQKELTELLNLWAESRATAMLLQWFLAHGDELMGSVTRPLTVTEIKPLEGPGKPGPIRATDLRESLRSLLDSA
jgi:hypothetical protein